MCRAKKPIFKEEKNEKENGNTPIGSSICIHDGT